MARFSLNAIVNYRPCGSCQACCTVLGIKELNKPIRTTCSHQCSVGCDIYENRPDTCRGYFCLWAMGVLEGDERRRPDNLGVIFDLRTDKEVVKPEDPKTIQVWEVWPGALRQPNVEFMVNKIAEKFPIVIRLAG